jgi:hypothetical protein
MRTRAIRRHHATRSMHRRLKEDRNQHYHDLTCPCWTDAKAMARFKEQPKRCACASCQSDRYNPWLSKSEQLTRQERRANIAMQQVLSEIVGGD